MLDDLKKQLIEKGASIVSFSDVSGLKNNKGYHYAITIGFKLIDEYINQIENNMSPTYEYFHHYRTVNAALDQMALFATMYLDRQGYKTMMIPASQSSVTDPYAGAFPHKTAAVLSGAGFIGKSGLFISSDYGPRVRLCTVLTDYPMDIENQPMQSKCGNCTRCVDACPANAIVGNEYIQGCSRDSVIDAEKCSNHMKKAYQKIGRGSVCGVCVAVCPYGKKRFKI